MIQTPSNPSASGRLPAVPRLTLDLGPDARIQFLPRALTYAADRRNAVRGSTLYAIIGVRADAPQNFEPSVAEQLGRHEFLGGYVGKTAALYSGPTGTGRPDSSWNHWVHAQRAIAPTGMALLHTPHLDPWMLSVLEARVITLLSTDMGCIALTNTHTSAEKAAARLTHRELATTLHLADEVAHAIWDHGYGLQTNPWPAPAPNRREAAVRIVLRLSRLERRAVTTREVVRELDKLGYPSRGLTRHRTVRRDLAGREQDSRCPRIKVLDLGDYPVYYAHDLTAEEALAGYHRKYPGARRTPGSAPAVRTARDPNHDPVSRGPRRPSSPTQATT